MRKLNNSWDEFFDVETNKDYYKKLRLFLIKEYKTQIIHPDMENIYSAFKTVPIENVKVVILGQDPYHQPGQAHGMAFSVMPGVPKPPSLKNIYAEIEKDIGIKMGSSGYLMPWAKQGVFLLNSALTVRENCPNSHKGKGWEILTAQAVKRLDADDTPKVFMLWGRDARNKKEFIKNPNHLILEAAHPSPLSAYNGFFGCKHFSKANDFLKSKGLTPIDWSINSEE
jgi:uracil-DNA glycosylase